METVGKSHEMGLQFTDLFLTEAQKKKKLQEYEEA